MIESLAALVFALLCLAVVIPLSLLFLPVAACIWAIVGIVTVYDKFFKRPTDKLTR